MSEINDGDGDKPDLKDDKNLYSGAEEISGVFDKEGVRADKRPQSGEKDWVEHEIKIGMYVEKHMQMVEIYQIRAKVRNSLRGVFERFEALSKIYGTGFIPPMTAQDIANEQRSLHSRKQKIMAADGKDVPERMLMFASADEYRDDDKIRREEKAKYTGGKFEAILKTGDYKKARAFAENERKKMKMPNDLAALNEILAIKAADAFTAAVLSGDAKKVIAAFYELTAIHRFKSSELLDLSLKQRAHPDLKKALLDELGLLVEADHMKYKVVKDYLVELGFLGKSEADLSKQVLEGMEKALTKSAIRHPVLYKLLKERMDKLGLPTDDCEKSRGEIEVAIAKWLAACMKSSGFQYLLVRDHWAEGGLINPDSADNSPMVIEASKESYKRLYDIHPVVYQLARFKLAQAGVCEPFDPQYLRSINYGKWKGLSNVDPSALGDFVTETIEEERADAARGFDTELDMELEAIKEQQREWYNGRRLFIRHYPQFRGIHTKRRKLRDSSSNLR